MSPWLRWAMYLLIPSPLVVGWLAVMRLRKKGKLWRN